MWIKWEYMQSSRWLPKEAIKPHNVLLQHIGAETKWLRVTNIFWWFSCVEIVIDLLNWTEISSQMARLAIDQYFFRLRYGIEKAMRFSLLTHVWVTGPLSYQAFSSRARHGKPPKWTHFFLGKAVDNSMIISNFILRRMFYDHLLFYELSKSMISRELWVTLR